MEAHRKNQKEKEQEEKAEKSRRGREIQKKELPPETKELGAKEGTGIGDGEVGQLNKAYVAEPKSLRERRRKLENAD